MPGTAFRKVGWKYVRKHDSKTIVFYVFVKYDIFIIFYIGMYILFLMRFQYYSYIALVISEKNQFILCYYQFSSAVLQFENELLFLLHFKI